MRQLPKPNLALLTVVLVWGYNFIAVKQLYHEMSPQAVALARALGMFALLIPICLLLKQSMRPKPGTGLLVLAFGFLSMGLYLILFFVGMQGSGAAEGAIMLATAPLFTTLFAVLLKQEKSNAGVWLGAAAALCGVSLVVWGGGGRTGNNELYNLIVLSSAAVWGISAVTAKILSASYTPLQTLTLSMPGGLIAMIPFGCRAFLSTDWAALSWHAWALLGYLIVAAGILGFALFYSGVRAIGAPGAMLYQYLISPTTALLSWALLGRPLHTSQFVGLAIVLAGVGWASKARIPDAVASGAGS